MSAHVKLLVTTTAAISAVLLGGQPAEAGTVEDVSDTFHDVFSNTCDGPEGAFEVVSDISGSFHYRLRRHGPDSNLYFAEHGSQTETHSNPATGRSWTAERTWHEHDTKILTVDGDLFTVRVQYDSRFVVFDETGATDSTNRGVSTFVLAVDTQGTPDPADDESDFVELIKSVGQNDVGDFCDDAVRFIVS
ncbi:MAG: hypothetical protein H0V42_08700 [Nocardioidaceae bacterium]|nr:hypothetical protein [Nocardioidaceae bacterium]